MTTFDISEVRTLAVAIEEAAIGGEIRTRLAIRKHGTHLADLARQLAPRDTGELAASIEPRYDRSGLGVSVSAWGIRYGAMVEHGTWKDPPQPFTMPARDAILPGFLADMGGAVSLRELTR